MVRKSVLKLVVVMVVVRDKYNKNNILKKIEYEKIKIFFSLPSVIKMGY